jgi:hypothetical protein
MAEQLLGAAVWAQGRRRSGREIVGNVRWGHGALIMVRPLPFRLLGFWKTAPTLPHSNLNLHASLGHRMGLVGHRVKARRTRNDEIEFNAKHCFDEVFWTFTSRYFLSLTLLQDTFTTFQQAWGLRVYTSSCDDCTYFYIAFSQLSWGLVPT